MSKIICNSKFNKITCFIVLIFISLFFLIVLCCFLPPFVRATGIVVDVIDTHYASPVLVDDPNSGKTEINRSCIIQFYSFLGIKNDVYYQQQYLEDYPYSLQEGDSVELLYNPIIPSRISLIW